MTAYSIVLRPVYSCPADSLPPGVTLPAGWDSLSWHQVETLEAIRNPNIDVIINTAMTGDGKSLAAYLETLLKGILQEYYNVIGMYPTNELARDQESQIRRYIELFKLVDELRVSRLSGPELEIYAESEGIKKWEAIATRTQQSEIILTNPDIFHYLHRHAYLTPKDSPNKLWSPIDTRFDLFIFDEFHIFNAPQIANVINTMLLIKHTNRHKKYLFLSATPDEQLIQLLEKSGFKTKLIDPLSENQYRFPDTVDRGLQFQGEGWRQIAREISLTFISLEPTYQATETWLWENRNLIEDYFQQHPGSKGAIILNSIAAVKRLTPKFKQFFQSLIVQENTSLTGKADKELSLEADLVLGTSTIDVGVDFKINFLIFESADAGSFIQRLGRLGRHDGYVKDGKEIAFNHFTAYALTPNFLVARLFEEKDTQLKTSGIYDRPYFHAQIRDKYRKINDFRFYYTRWAGVLSVLLSSSQGLAHKTIKQQYAGSHEAFKNDCEKAFDTNLRKVTGCTKKWAREWQDLSNNKTGNPIAEDACSFRGSSSLHCGLYDLTERNEADRFKTYDLPGILSNLEIEPMTEVAYLRLLQETAERTGQPIPKGRFERCLAFMKLQNYREERLNWKFIYQGNLVEIADAWKVQVLLGIQVLQQPGTRWINEINKRLKLRGLVSYVIRFPVEEAKKRLQLPMHFQIYPIDESGRHEPGTPYSVAFGQSALLLDTLAYRLKSKGGETWIC